MQMRRTRRRGGTSGSSPARGALVRVDGASVVVKPEMALAQLEAERTDAAVAGQTAEEGGEASEAQPGEVGVANSEPRRFYGSIALDPVRMSRDAGQVADEVVKHLVGHMGSEVEVRVEITATSEDGFPDDVVRTVTENSRTLKFDQHGFERRLAWATAAPGSC